MKSFIKTFLRAGIFFGLFMGIFYTFLTGVEFGLLAGFLGGIFFGLSMAVLSTFLEIRAQKEAPDFDGETIIKRSAGSHIVNGLLVGGFLYLTDKHLHFRPHRFNIRAQVLSIPVPHISEAEKGTRLGILPDKLTVSRTDGTPEIFAVTEVGEWADEINDVRGNYLENPRSEDARLFP